jgi:hypothetical protein
MMTASACCTTLLLLLLLPPPLLLLLLLLQVREFDDIIVSMMGLSGWLAVIYFFRWEEQLAKLVSQHCSLAVDC